MNFPNCVFLWFSSSVGTIRRRVIDIEEGFACDRDYVLLAHFEPLGFLETERKALRRPAENKLPKLTPRGADRNFGINTSRFLTVGIFEHESNVTICLNFQVNHAAREVIPFLFSCDSRIRLGRQRHIRLRPFPFVNLRWRNRLNGRFVQRHRRRIRFGRPATTALLALTLARRDESRCTRCHGFSERRANDKGRKQTGEQGAVHSSTWVKRAYTTSTSILETSDFRSFARTSASSFLGSIFAGM